MREWFVSLFRFITNPVFTDLFHCEQWIKRHIQVAVCLCPEGGSGGPLGNDGRSPECHTRTGWCMRDMGGGEARCLTYHVPWGGGRKPKKHVLSLPPPRPKAMHDGVWIRARPRRRRRQVASSFFWVVGKNVRAVRKKITRPVNPQGRGRADFFNLFGISVTYQKKPVRSICES